MPNSRISPLGGGLPGGMPKALYNTNNSSAFVRTRFLLLNGWNKGAARRINSNKSATSPFRAINNAGDLLNRVAYTSGCSNQVNTGRTKLAANATARFLGGSIFAKPDGSGVPSATTNVKWVYVGSDYVKFKRQQAENRSYNDWNFGGSNNGSYPAIMRVRH